MTTQYTITFTALEHKFKWCFYTQKRVLNVRFKDFWYTKINPTQIWYDEFDQLISIKGKNAQQTKHECLTFNAYQLNSSYKIRV